MIMQGTEHAITLLILPDMWLPSGVFVRSRVLFGNSEHRV